MPLQCAALQVLTEVVRVCLGAPTEAELLVFAAALLSAFPKVCLLTLDPRPDNLDPRP